MKLNVKAFALACGILWGIGLFLITWWIIFFEGTACGILCIEHLYLGYDISPIGSFIGLLWGFIDGLICGAVFAWLYNFIATRTAK